MKVLSPFGPKIASLKLSGGSIRKINIEEIELDFKEKKKKFDPKEVYKGQPNPTKL